ncbi:MAG: DUF3786 domain-containing protein [Anaerolineae bacterium]
MIPADTHRGLGRTELALTLAREHYAAIAARDIAQRAGVPFVPGEEGRALAVPFLGRTYRVTYPEGEVSELDTGAPAKHAVRLLILHHLAQADGHPLEARWVAFRELPDGLMYDIAFRGRVEPPLATAFASDLDRLAWAARSLGGRYLELGDAAWALDLFPRLPMAVIIYQADDEFPATACALFDASAGHYLPTEDLAIAGGMLVGALLRAARQSQAADANTPLPPNTFVSRKDK